MKVLLDTHVWLWMVAAPERLSVATRAVLSSADTEIWLSTASCWELAIKYGLGKLALPEPPLQFVPSRLLRDGVRTLPVAPHHALAVADLPPLHNDPFDRMLVVQARAEGLTLLTVDAAVLAYGAAVMAA